MTAAVFRGMCAGCNRIARVIGVVVAIVAMSNHSGTAQPSVDEIAGQSSTSLPDGRELLLGGTNHGETVAFAWLKDRQTDVSSIIGRLQQARAGHTATLLSDGTVLVLGGVSSTGRVVDTVERFNVITRTSEVLPPLRWTPRAAHTATLVSADEIIVCGGVDDRGFSAEVERIDLNRWQDTAVAMLPGARAYHAATLTPDGQVAVWGGRGPGGALESSGVLVDPSTGALQELSAPPLDGSAPQVARSDPENGATGVSVAVRIALRFTRLALIPSVNSTTVTLLGPEGRVAALIVPAENGRIAFVTPSRALRPDATYVLSVNGAHDARGFPFEAFSVTFTTAREERAQTPDHDDEWSFDDDWRTNQSSSHWQNLPALEAGAGVTALSGQVLKLNGSPLAGVRLEIDGASAVSDGTGRFLLVVQGESADWRELWIDGRVGRGRGARYGTYEVAVRLHSGRTTVLPYTIWLTRIDVENAVAIQPPTPAETIVTTPRIPGLELRLPPGTVIRDEQGAIVREVSITPIPLDRPPFPLPATVDVPVYFTIQPGGAYVEVSARTGYGARLIYPNYRHRPPGSPMEFWHYDPEDGRGWYVYGLGAVTADALQVAPNRGVAISEFTGAMVAPPSLPPPDDTKPGNCPREAGDPVNCGNGVFTLNHVDASLPDVIPINLTRTYRTGDIRSRAFGIGATHNYDMFLVGDTVPYTYIDLILSDGARVHYTRISPGTGWTDAVYEHAASPTGFFKSTIRWNGDGWDLRLLDGTLLTFPESAGVSRSQQAALTRIRDRFGNTLTLNRNADRDLASVVSPNGRWMQFTYDTQHRITAIADNIGRTTTYSYDASGRLWTVTDAAGGVTAYTYDAAHRMLTHKDARGNVVATNEYDSAGRIANQTLANGGAFQFAYTLNGAGRIAQADVTNPRGIVRRFQFDSAGYTVGETLAAGQPEQQNTTYERQTGTNMIAAIVDALGRRTQFTYDQLGNTTNVTRLAGTPDASTFTLTYEPTLQQVATITDPLGRTTVATYQAGTVSAISDPLGHTKHLQFDSTGQLISVESPLGHDTQLAYSLGDLISAIGPNNETFAHFIDAAGRVVRTTTPAGRISERAFDALNRVTSTVDGLQNETTAAYDANGNLLLLRDARGGATTFTYDRMNRVASRTDPLQRSESYIYDLNGNLTEVRDRKGQSTTYTYDAIDRLSLVTYADQSTTRYSYDRGNRLVAIEDSLAGTITRSYDGLDHLTAETSPEGNVSYGYDRAGQRLTMNVPGAATVAYSYDDAGRIASIAQGDLSVVRTYDDDDRVTSVALPNNISVTVSYDAASRPLTLSYASGQTTIGNLTYRYDADGNRTAVGGSFARTGLPPAVSSAVYDAANEVTARDSAAFTYDANGNLSTADAVAFTWNARDQLTALSGGVSASFAYDGVGRRRAKVVGGQPVAFLYDGGNPVQESRPTSSTNILSGLMLDEFVARTDEAGTVSYLADALGDVVALARDSGISTSYTYEPFGAVVAEGALSSNSYEFMGRENDATGLFYYRARYYSPGLSRFISEDPLPSMRTDGLIESSNLYEYVGNNPINWSDPTGTQRLLLPSSRLPRLPILNGNLWPGFTFQQPGCDFPASPGNRFRCLRQCCDDHDRCYEQFRCNASSHLAPAVGLVGPCTICNIKVYLCFMLNEFTRHPNPFQPCCVPVK